MNVSIWRKKNNNYNVIYELFSRVQVVRIHTELADDISMKIKVTEIDGMGRMNLTNAHFRMGWISTFLSITN